MGEYGGSFHAGQWDEAWDLVNIVYGYGLFTGGLGAHYGAERLGCTVVPVSGGMTERQVTLIQDFKPSTIMVTPSYMLNILEQFNSMGIDPRDTSLDVGIFGAEPWTNAMRQEVEAAFDMHAVDIYGLSEILGQELQMNALSPRTGYTFGKIIFILKSSTQKLEKLLQMAKWVSWCLRPSQRRVCP